MKKYIFLTFILFALIRIKSQAQTQLWSMASKGGGAGKCGVIFKMNLDGSGYVKLHSFDSITGYYPCGSLLYAANRKIYGMNNIDGEIFSYDPFLNVYNHIFYCDTATGLEPSGSFVQASNGKLYGTANGYVPNKGTIFSFDTNTYIVNIDYRFNIFSGAQPQGDIVEATNGKFYGMTPQWGSTSNGVIYSYDTATSTYTDLYNLNPLSGTSPFGNLIQATDGLLYGLTYLGGINDMGVLFSFNPISNTFTRLFDFDSINGKQPVASLIQATDGKLYGMTSNGGTHNVGVLFSYDITSSTFTKLYDFNTPTGGGPNGSLFQASNGKLYGMTHNGGTYTWGTIFNYDITSSVYTKLRDLNPAINDGIQPLRSAFIELPYTPNVGIGELTNDNQINIYPNPATSAFTIISTNKIKQIKIFNVLGEELKTVTNTETVDMTGYSKGIYVVEIKTEKGVVRRKVVKE